MDIIESVLISTNEYNKLKKCSEAIQDNLIGYTLLSFRGNHPFNYEAMRLLTPIESNHVVTRELRNALIEIEKLKEELALCNTDKVKTKNKRFKFF